MTTGIAVTLLLVLLLGLAGVGALLGLRRLRFTRLAEAVWRELAMPLAALEFAPEMTAGVPEPARRYLLHAIAPAAPLASFVELRWSHSHRLGPSARTPPMQAEQLVASPRGLVWTARFGAGPGRVEEVGLWLRGRGRTRRWRWGIVPAHRARTELDSAALATWVALGTVLLPSALLPVRGAVWRALDARRARVELTIGEQRIAMILTVSEDGRLERAEVLLGEDRASGPGRPCGTCFIEAGAEERRFGDYTLPTRLRFGCLTPNARAHRAVQLELTSAVHR